MNGRREEVIKEFNYLAYKVITLGVRRRYFLCLYVHFLVSVGFVECEIDRVVAGLL